MNIFTKTFLEVIISLIASILAAIGSVAWSYVIGILLKVFFGNMLVDGLNIIFNTTRFTPECIPIICMLLGLFFFYMKDSVQIERRGKGE